MFEKLKKRFFKDNERGARRGLMEELFQDFNRNQAEVYKMNFIRGLFFGFGSVLGGTVLVAVVIWLLNAVGIFVPALSDLIESVIKDINSRG